MVKNTNQRITITLPKKCIKGLQTLADLNSTTLSKIVLMMVNKKSSALLTIVTDNCSFRNQMTLHQLANVKWVDD